MFSRTFYAIAGIDAGTMGQCPKTDRMWGVHLGAWLILSFLLTFMISLHSTGYVPTLNADLPLRIVVATLIALSIFLFDRALYQSDWFRQGYFRPGHTSAAISRMGFVGKLSRVGGRLMLSGVIAYVLSVFLELAIFSGAILDRLHHEHRTVNAPYLARIDLRRKEEERLVDGRRAELSVLQKELMAIGAKRDAIEDPTDTRLQDIAQEQERVQKREQVLLADIRSKRAEISARKLEVICETEGTKPDGSDPDRCSGVRSCGPRCRTAIQLVRVHEGELETLQSQLELTRGQAKSLGSAKDKLVAEIRAKADARRADLDERRRALETEILRKEAELVASDLAIPVRMKAFADELKSSPGYVKFQDDPLMRLRALADLKADTKYGPVVTWFAIGLKLLIIFLEVVPVCGKIFFSPPSAYAIHIQKRVERHQRLDLYSPTGRVCETPEDAEDPQEVWRQGSKETADSGQRTAALHGRHLTVVG